MKEFISNERIRSHVIILISSNGENKGQFTKTMAIQTARSEGLDLVQVSSGDPPVCKIVDIGKMKYEASKIQKNSHSPVTKEIKFGIDIAQHDLDIKLKKAEELIRKGHKVIVVAILSGRQKFSANHKMIARDKIKEISARFCLIATVTPAREAESAVSVTISPK